MWELSTNLEQLPAWEFALYPGKLEAGGPHGSLAPTAGSKPWREDQGEIDNEGGHLYDHMQMLYEEAFCLEPVQTQGMEDAIGLVQFILSFYHRNFLTLNSGTL